MRTRPSFKALAIALSLYALTAPAAAQDMRATPESKGGEGQRTVVTAEKFMVVSANPLATKAGYDVLKEGGSAVDAAIATMLVLNVVEPQSQGIGGGGFAVIYDAKTGNLTSFDGRETAPMATKPDHFIGPDGKRMGFFQAVISGRSVAVPAMPRLLETLHKRDGRLPLKRLAEPAAKIAEEGFAVSPRLAALIAHPFATRAPWPAEAKAYFYLPEGGPKPAGTIIKNPKLAKTMRTFGAKGAEPFYTGAIAKEILATVNQAIPAGQMTAADLKNYKVLERAPICSPYRQYRVCGMDAPSSGGVVVNQFLMLMEGFDVAKMTPGSAEAVHLMAEAFRLAYADRNMYLADPAFVPQPGMALLDRTYVAERRKLMEPLKAGPAKQPAGTPMGKQGMMAMGLNEPFPSTTHVSVVDKDGNAVAFTGSIETAFGSRLMAGGFLLNNHMTDFDFEPVRDGKPVANRPEGGKRSRSSMSPTIVFDENRKPVIVIGAPGGSRIPGFVARSLVHMLDWGQDPQTAISAPHAMDRNDGFVEIEADTPILAIKPALEAMGHRVVANDMNSGIQAIEIRNGKLSGGADPRRESAAMGD